MMVLGYNLCQKDRQPYCFSISDVMMVFSSVFLLTGVLSGIITILQWLNFSQYFSFIMPMYGNRPYANIAQPNHLSTLLFLSLVSCLYLFEKNKLETIVSIILSLIIIISIVLTQSRTAWVVLCFYMYFAFFKFKIFKMRKNALILWFVFFILCFAIVPGIHNIFNIKTNIVSISSVVERASSGYLRLQIWNQMMQAIIEKPWSGYGWNQTSSAQYVVIDKYPGKEWATSAHNIILDILIWCGIPLGLIIILSLSCLLLKMIYNVNNIEKVCLVLMISPILIHSLFEYPLYYSYFLLPFGLLLGLLLWENSFSSWRGGIHPIFTFFIFWIGIFFISIIFNDYNKISDNIIAANAHEMNELRSEVDLPYKNYIFSEFENRTKWIALHPHTKMSSENLNEIRSMVKMHITSYDLYKFAQILAFNGYEEEAKKQLLILEKMYGEKHNYKNLLDN